jgi:FHA domain
VALERCPSGHLYDPAKHTSCPYCGVADLDFGKTHPKRPAPDYSGEEPEEMRTRPKDQAPRGGADPGATQGFYRRKLGLDPVVGWLVCIEGNDRGRDFRIRSENNFVGRSEQMDICIPGDEGISRENHAIITFDPKHNSFTLSPGNARGIVYLNGEAVHSPADLGPYFEIQMGSTRLMFVPFCGDRFQWEE